MLDEVEDYEIMFIMYVISVMLTLMASLLSLHVENINTYTCMYILWVYDEERDVIVNKTITFVPGLYKKSCISTIGQIF